MSIPRCFEITGGECVGCPICSGLKDSNKKIIRTYYINKKRSNMTPAQETQGIGREHTKLLDSLSDINYDCPWIRLKSTVTDNPVNFIGGTLIGFSMSYGLYKAGEYAYNAYMNR